MLRKFLLYPLMLLLLIIAGFDAWGYLTLGQYTPQSDPERNPYANQVVLVTGATGSVGDGLLKAALADPDVARVIVITRRSSPRIEAGAASGKLTVLMHQDFTDYSPYASLLAEVNTVLWGLGTSSIGMDDATYTRIHVDFPMAFLTAWLAARQQAPMAFHFVTGMGTDPEGSSHWAREKGRTEREMAELAEGTGLRTFSYRSAFVRPTSEQANLGHRILEGLLRPGGLVVTATELGQAMLEISARTAELANGSLIDNVDTIAYARAYGER